MKPIYLLLIPCVVLFVSACAEPAGPAVVDGGPPGPVYGYGPGPNPQPGYYWNGTVYVEGPSPYHHSDHYSRNVNDVTDVNRTTVNDRTVNNTTVNNTNVNDRTVNRTNVNKTTVDKANVKKKRTHKPDEQTNQQGPQ